MIYQSVRSWHLARRCQITQTATTLLMVGIASSLRHSSMAPTAAAATPAMVDIISNLAMPPEGDYRGAAMNTCPLTGIGTVGRR